MLRLDNVSKVYRTTDVETSALDHVSMEILPGEFVGDHGAIGLRQVDLAQHIGPARSADRRRL